MNQKLLSLMATMMLPTAALAAPLPAAHYHKTTAGVGDLWVRPDGAGYVVYVDAGGVPRGGATAADCPLLAKGTITNGVFHGTVIDQPDPGWKPWDMKSVKNGDENEPDPGNFLDVRFSSTSAMVTNLTSNGGALCGDGTGIYGTYKKR